MVFHTSGVDLVSVEGPVGPVEGLECRPDPTVVEEALGVLVCDVVDAVGAHPEVFSAPVAAWLVGTSSS